MTDIGSLPPTQYLILDVLAARHRLGQEPWPFPPTCNRALAALESSGLVTLTSSVGGPGNSAWLTEAGKGMLLHVSPPNGGIERLRAALQAILDYAEPRADLVIGLDAIVTTARQALEGGPR